MSSDKTLIISLFNAAFYFKNNDYDLHGILKDFELFIPDYPFNGLFYYDFFFKNVGEFNEDNFLSFYKKIGDCFNLSNYCPEELFCFFSELSNYNDISKKIFDDVSHRLNKIKKQPIEEKIHQSDNIAPTIDMPSCDADIVLSVNDISILLDDDKDFDLAIKQFSKREMHVKWNNILNSLSVNIRKQEDLLSFSEKNIKYILSMIICFPSYCTAASFIMEFISNTYDYLAKDVYRKIILSGEPEMALSSLRDDIFMPKNIGKNGFNKWFSWGCELVVECIRDDYHLIHNYNYIDFIYIIFKDGSDECIGEFDKIIDAVLVNKPADTDNSYLIWLVIKFFTSKEVVYDKLFEFIKSNPKSIWSVIEFSKKWHDELNYYLFPLQKYYLILIIGFHAPLAYRPSSNHEKIKNLSDESQFIIDTINSLSSMPNSCAGNYLKRLLEEDYLSSYCDYIKHAMAQQASVHRAANYKQPSFDKVIASLRNTCPANIADLHALIIDHLNVLKKEILYGNTDMYKAFWQCNSYGQPDKPVIEDICRDRLIDFLSKKLLPLKLHLEPEAHMANDKRADIVVYANSRMKLPLELKRNKHPDVWNACMTQLARLYTRDPDASGYGIYVVFWFGDKITTRLDGVSKPNSASEMESKLRERIPDAKRHYLDVVVIDVVGFNPNKGSLQKTGCV